MGSVDYEIAFIAISLVVLATGSLLLNVVVSKLFRVTDRGTYWSLNLGLLPLASAAYGMWNFFTYRHPPCIPPEGFSISCGYDWFEEKTIAAFDAFIFILMLPLGFVSIAISITMVLEKKLLGTS